MSKLSPEGEIVASFLARIAGDLYTGKGVNVGFSDMKVMSAGKSIRADGINVLRGAFMKLEDQHPEAVDILVAGLGEVIKARVRKAAGG